MKDKKQYKILVVDDEKDIQEFIEYNLKKEGYDVFLANNGIEAIEEALDADRNRGKSSNQVLDTQIASIEVVDRLPPLGEVVLTVNVRYIFTRGTT
jgi:CheY-like chemotaxis protein